MAERPFAPVIIPTLNEAGHLPVPMKRLAPALASAGASVATLWHDGLHTTRTWTSTIQETGA